MLEEGLLPKEGLISVEELARRLGVKSKYNFAKQLEAKGIPIFSIGTMLSKRLIRLEDFHQREK
jgi:hypothetical protein